MRTFFAGCHVYFECFGEFVIRFSDVQGQLLSVASCEYGVPLDPFPGRCFSMHLVGDDFYLVLKGAEGGRSLLEEVL